MNNQNTPLDFNQLKLAPYDLLKQLKFEIDSIYHEISGERVTKIEEMD